MERKLILTLFSGEMLSGEILISLCLVETFYKFLHSLLFLCSAYMSSQMPPTKSPGRFWNPGTYHRTIFSEMVSSLHTAQS